MMKTVVVGGLVQKVQVVKMVNVVVLMRASRFAMEYAKLIQYAFVNQAIT